MKHFGKLFPVFALIALALSPTQLTFNVMNVRMTIGDLLLAPALALGILSRRCVRIPAECLAFIALAAASAIFAPIKSEAVKELVQVALYFAAAWSVIDGAMRDGRWRSIAVAVFLVTGAAIVAVALVQYFMPSPDVFPLNLRKGLCVRGLFSNNNVLSGYLALLAPLAFSMALDARGWGRRIALFALVLCSLSVMLSGPALAATCVAISALAFGRRKWLGAVTAAALVALFVFAAPHAPRDNFTSTVTSALPYHVDGGAVAYTEGATLEWQAGEPTRRYPEWQAATMMTLERPLIGVGPGSYQRNIGAFYDAVPRATGPSEPDIQNLYLVMASTMGIPALSVFLAILAGSFAMGLRSDDVRSRGAAAAIAAFSVAAIFHPLLVRGIGVPLVFMLVLARRRCDLAEQETP